MSVRITKLLSCLYSVLIICQIICLSAAGAAAAVEMPFEPMGKPGAPLGTVWITNLDPSLKAFHLQMVQRELAESSRVGIQTNIAMFGLNLRMKDGNFVPILDRSSKPFLSGGAMLVRPETEELEDISAKRARYGDDLGKKENALKEARSELTKFAGNAGSDVSEVDVACLGFGKRLRDVRKIATDVSQASELISKLTIDETNYALPLFRNPRYNDHANATYDPEQTIARIVDYHISQSVVNDGELTLNAGCPHEKV